MMNHVRVMKAFTNSLSQGTWQNKANQVRIYLAFCEEHSVNPLQPEEYDIISFIYHLQCKLRSPGAVMNYISGVKTWLKTCSGKSEVFDSYLVTVMKKGVSKNSDHSVIRAEPITPNDLCCIIDYLSVKSHYSKVVVALLLIAYHTLLRQSNLLPSSAACRSQHMLKFSDISCNANNLIVLVSSTKTRTSADPGLKFVIPALPASRYCAVKAWSEYTSGRHFLKSGPAFVLHSGYPLTVSVCSKVLKLAMKELFPERNCRFTLHSLRRGAAQACLFNGVSLKDIKKAGTWRGDSVYHYVPKIVIKEAPTALGKLLG